MAIELGANVKCSVTGYVGVVVARTVWLYGCVRIQVQGPIDKDGKVPEIVGFDEDQLTVIKKTKKANGKKKDTPPAGGRPVIKRQADLI